MGKHNRERHPKDWANQDNGIRIDSSTQRDRISVYKVQFLKAPKSKSVQVTDSHQFELTWSRAE